MSGPLDTSGTEIDLDRLAQRAAWTLGTVFGCLLIAVFAAGFALGKAW